MSKEQLKKMKNAANLVHAYKEVFDTENGKQVLYDLMKNHFILTPIFGKGLEPHEIFAREGERNVVLKILSLLKYDEKTLHERIAEYERTISNV